MRPYQDGKARAVGEAERRQIRYQGLGRAVQSIEDGLPQVVRAGDVELALKPYQGPLAMVFGAGKEGEGVHLRRFRWAVTW
jgi:hypothetical protein